MTGVYCAVASDGGGGGNQASGTNLIDDILSQGNNFFNPGKDEGENPDGTPKTTGATVSKYFKDNIIPIIETLGLLIFYVVAAILGIRYIWSGVEGKSKVKETLPTFVVGACFFFLADNIYKFTSGTLKDVLSGNSFSVMQGSIWGNVSFLVNIFAIAGIVALGLKYMLNSADTRAEIKKDLVPVFIGLILVFATTNILSFISKVGIGILQ
jgi:hypothetical protein